MSKSSDPDQCAIEMHVLISYVPCLNQPTEPSGTKTMFRCLPASELAGLPPRGAPLAAMSEMEELSPVPSRRTPRRNPRVLRLDPVSQHRRVLEDQVELWWFHKPRRSMFCYGLSVCLVLGLGIAGVGLLSTTTSLSSEWRLGVGTMLCLLALAVLLKQLLSSAVQDMNCVHSRRCVELMKSGGRADPVIILATGMALAVCGGVLLYVSLTNGHHGPGQRQRDMFLAGLALLGAGSATGLAVVGYSLALSLQERRERRMLRRRRVGGRGLRNRAVMVFTVPAVQMTYSSSRVSLI
ncbi:transmembrane protein 125-like [Esox lucius]|uniref:Transmembrane protein 125b n=1 Tax=Esox lucius TaxID=8010 RepID=A0A3P8XHG3_ESOLU|nr:transmembrane protein 125-like [Esox lucius]